MVPLDDLMVSVYELRLNAFGHARGEVCAWALSRGPHVDAAYREDGALCGFLSGPPVEYAIDQFRFAVEEVRGAGSRTQPRGRRGDGLMVTVSWYDQTV